MESNILNKVKVTVEEMKQYYASNFPFEANKKRVGMFAKQSGFRLAKQMRNGVYEYFYIKNNY